MADGKDIARTFRSGQGSIPENQVALDAVTKAKVKKLALEKRKAAAAK